MDVAVIPEAERTGRLRIATGVHVSRLDVADDGRVRGVIAHDEQGSQRRYRAPAVVLATGAIETPRILLSSVGRAHPHGVGNADDQVGRNLMEFLYLSRFVLFERSLESYAGLPLDSRIWDFNGAGQAGRVANGFVLGQSCGVFEGPLGYALEGGLGFGVEHREGMARSFGAGLELMGIAEQLPRPENRVRLSEQPDRFSMPLAHVETRLDAADLAVLSEIWERLGDLAEAARVERIVGQLSTYDRPDASHVGGTCRMGRTPETSVVDRFGAVHGHPNLVIADASVLVTQGAGDSPSLTLQALALRAAEALAQRATRGELLSGPTRTRS